MHTKQNELHVPGTGRQPVMQQNGTTQVCVKTLSVWTSHSRFHHRRDQISSPLDAVPIIGSIHSVLEPVYLRYMCSLDNVVTTMGASVH